MSFDGLLNLPVTLHIVDNDGPEDEHGNPTDTENSYATTGFVGRQTASELGAESIPQETFRLFLRADAPIDGYDAVTVFGVRYEVMGPPWHVYLPRIADIHHVEANLRRAA